MGIFFSRKENEEQIKREGRLPPGQTLTEKFPVLHYGQTPQFNAATWSFRIWGEVARSISLTWDEFNRLPHTRIIMDIHCVTRWSKFNTKWEGITLETLEKECGLEILPGAKYVIQHAEYGFTANLPLPVVRAPNFLLATAYEEKPLSPDHGYPLRGVAGAIPERHDLKDVYFWKGAKWLRGLEFLPFDRPGFWEKAGYHNEADIWKEQRVG